MPGSRAPGGAPDATLRDGAWWDASERGATRRYSAMLNS